MIVYGASGHAKVIIEILEANGVGHLTLWDIVERPPLWDYKIVSPQENPGLGEEMIIAIGANNIRKKIDDQYAGKVEYALAVHPHAAVSGRATIGAGTVVMAGVSINADTAIGRHCIINTNASIDHDCRIADYVHVSPNAALCGSVKVGEGTHIGAGATVIPGVSIGRWCTVGAGSVVLSDVPDYATVVGIPARTIKFNYQKE